MTTIRLKVKKSQDLGVEARTIPAGGSQPDHRKGNVDAEGGTQIEWHGQSGNEASLYTVRFFKLSDGSATWPFVELEDGTGIAPTGYTGPLTLTPGQRVRLTTKAEALTVKYEVSATHSEGKAVDDLDPMIIIRPGLRSIVAAGLPWAVAGAALGAVLTALLSGPSR
jgi:hypothetical protein